MKNTYKNRYC